MSRAEPELAGRQVPTCTTAEFFPRRSRYCVIVFVIDEGEKIRRQLERMRTYAKDVDVIVADGGSVDGSLDPAHLQACAVRALLTKTGSGRLGAQMRMAFAYALDEGYPGVITIDGNGKDGVEAIPRFAALLDQGYDHVQGSRFVPGGRAVNTPLDRLLAVRLLHAPLISLAARHRHTDTTNGFRAYSARLLADPDVAVFRDVFSAYQLHYHLAIEAARRGGYRLVETPVSRTYPRGVVPTKITSVRARLGVLRQLVGVAAGRYRTRPW